MKQKAVAHVEKAVRNLKRTQLRACEDELPIERQRREQQEETLRLWEFILLAVEKYD